MVNSKLKTQAIGLVCTISLLGMVILLSAAVKIKEIHKDTEELVNFIKIDSSYTVDLENENYSQEVEIARLKLELSIAENTAYTLKDSNESRFKSLLVAHKKEVEMLKSAIREKDILLASEKAEDFSDVIDHDLLTENRKLRNDLMVEKSKVSALEKVIQHKEAASTVVIEDLKSKLRLINKS